MSREYDGFGPEMKVLIILFKNGRIKRSNFQGIHGMNYNTAQTALQYLESAGLTKYEAVGDRRDTVYWSLTDKGKKAAQTLADLDEFIRNG